MDTPTYCDWMACRLRVASGLHVDPDALPAHYDPVIAQACRDAAAEIKRTFVVKGYSPATLAASDDARVYNEQLGAFFALVRLASLANYDLKAVEYLDCRKQMQEAAALVVDGAAVAGGDTDVGGVAHGTLAGLHHTEHHFRRF